jgi:hypothetical protein
MLARRRRPLVAAVPFLLCLGLLLAAPAAAVHVLDFERLAAGSAVREASPGVLLEVSGPDGRASRALAVEVLRRGGHDDSDSERMPSIRWRRGNLSRGSDLGIVLVLADGKRRDYGGSLSIHFGRPMTSLGFDLVDVEGRLGVGSLEFLLDGTRVSEVDFSEFLDPTSALYDATLVFRRFSGNRIGPFASALAGAPFFDEVVFHLDGLIALDNVVVAEASPVPEPATLGLLGMGLVVLGRRRGRASAA